MTRQPRPGLDQVLSPVAQQRIARALSVAKPGRPRVQLGAGISRYECELLSHRPEETQRSYKTVFAHLLAELGKERYVDEITAEEVYQVIQKVWLNSPTRFLESQELRPATYERRRGTVMSLWNFLAGCGYEMGLMKLPPRGLGKHLPRGLTLDEAQRLLRLAKRTRFGIRNQALVATFLLTGCRIGEVAALNVGSIGQDSEGRLFFHVHGKGDKDRLAPITAALRPFLDEYLKIHPLADQPQAPLFVGERQDFAGKRLSERSIRLVLTPLIRRAVVNKTDDRAEPTVHSLRHTFAVLAMDSGIPMPEVQQLMGHESPETTSVYTRVSVRQLYDTLERYAPFSKKPAPENSRSVRNCEGGARKQYGS